jgi:hypothetical protein
MFSAELPGTMLVKYPLMLKGCCLRFVFMLQM